MQQNHSQLTKVNTYIHLLETIATTLAGQPKSNSRAQNTTLLQTYWSIGEYIVLSEQEGKSKAQYGIQYLERMAKQLFNKFGSGFSRSNLIYMRKLFLFFPFREILSKKLSWSHYFEILKTNDRAAITWLVRQCEEHSWSVRQLKEQIKAGAHHWITITTSKPKTTTRESKSLLSWFKTQLNNLKQPQTQKNLQFVRRCTSYNLEILNSNLSRRTTEIKQPQKKSPIRETLHFL